MTFQSSNRFHSKNYDFELKIKDLTNFRSKVIEDVRTVTPYKQKNVKDASRSKLERMSKMAALNQSPTYFCLNVKTLVEKTHLDQKICGN